MCPCKRPLKFILSLSLCLQPVIVFIYVFVLSLCLLTLLPYAVQVTSISMMQSRGATTCPLAYIRQISVYRYCWSSYFLIFWFHFCPLSVINHFSAVRTPLHFPIHHLSSPASCQITIAIPQASAARFIPNVQSIPSPPLMWQVEPPFTTSLWLFPCLSTPSPLQLGVTTSVRFGLALW